MRSTFCTSTKWLPEPIEPSWPPPRCRARSETAPGSPARRSTGPTRLLDTRIGLGVDPAGPSPTASDDHEVPAGGAVRLALPGVPGDATAAVLNVTAVDPDADGWVQVVPGDGSVAPGTSSNLNVRAGQTVANLVVVPTADAPSTCSRSPAPTWSPTWSAT